MLKILERLSAGRPSVDAAVLDKVLRLADGLELWSARSYELTRTAQDAGPPVDMIAQQASKANSTSSPAVYGGAAGDHA